MIILILGVAFYWFQYRPTQIYSYCNYKAQEDAKNALKDKTEIGADIYKEAVEKGMYLKDDYEYAYKKCLRENGIENND